MYYSGDSDSVTPRERHKIGVAGGGGGGAVRDGAGLLGPWNRSVGPPTRDACPVAPVRPKNVPPGEGTLRGATMWSPRGTRVCSALRTQAFGGAVIHSPRTDAFHPVPQDTRIRGDAAPGAPTVGDSVSPPHRRRVPCPAIDGCRRQCGATVSRGSASPSRPPAQPAAAGRGPPPPRTPRPGALPSGPAESPPPAAAARGPGFTSAVRARRSRQRSSAWPLLAPRPPPAAHSPAPPRRLARRPALEASPQHAPPALSSHHLS